MVIGTGIAVRMVAAVAVLAGAVTMIANTGYSRPSSGVAMPASRPGASRQPRPAIQPRPAANPVSTLPAPPQLFAPELVAVMPDGFSSAQVLAVRRAKGIRAALPVAGGQVVLNGKTASVLGVSSESFRAWTPSETAGSGLLWAYLDAGNLVATPSAAQRLGLSLGATYQVGGITPGARVGAEASLGVPGVDAIVNEHWSGLLRLVPDAAILISTSDPSITTLTSMLRRVLGKQAVFISLVPEVSEARLTRAANTAGGANTAPGGAPTSWLQLFKESAAEFCPGLSWTVLAAIGQVESGDGANEGPSSAGAEGPMQFLPATWAQWGITGFGRSGTRPDVMNPLDAVPSAARMLCADGAVSGQSGLSQAIYAYNHAWWYVSEILQLAGEYAKEYS